MKKLTVKDLGRIIANPFYCLSQIHPAFSSEHKIMITEEEWIKCGVNSIKENGAEEYLRNLLENLKGNYVSSPDDEDIVDGYKSVPPSFIK